MHIDEDTCEWLGLPSPLEMYQQQCLLLENEIHELNQQLRKAREDIFGLIKMLDDERAKKDEYASYLRRRGAEAAAMRKQISGLTTSANLYRREIGDLRFQLGNAEAKR